MNKTHAQRWIGIGALALILPVAAAAQQAFTRGGVNLRAGPSGDYPVVASLGPGQPLDVIGCTSGYGWCDVVLPDELRGWVAAQSLDYAYDDQRVPLATYGAAIGIPIVGFAIGNYWANNYRDRPWYGDRRFWGGRPPPPAQGWRPGPPPRPGWQPNPYPGAGFAPGGRPGYGGPGYGGGRPGYPPPQGNPQQGFRPQQPGYQPQPGYRPQPGGQQPGFRPGGGQPGSFPGVAQPGRPVLIQPGSAPVGRPGFHQDAQ